MSTSDGPGGSPRGPRPAAPGPTPKTVVTNNATTGEWHVDSAHRTLLDNLPVIVFRHSIRRKQLTFVNKAWERILGRPVAEAYEHGLARALPDDVARAELSASIARAAAGEEVPWCEAVFVATDGRRVTVRLMLYPVRDERGNVEAVEAIGRDVQAEVDARRKLIQTDRLAAIGQLAAGIAHEINNPAAFVALNLQHLTRTYPRLRDGLADADMLARFEQTLEETSLGVQRIVSTINELKLFARIPEGAFSTPVDVNRLVRSAIVLTKSEIRHRASLVTDLDEELPLLPGDHARLGQVFVNLLFNAAQAIPPGDVAHHVVRIETRAVKERIRIRITDTGVGIPLDVLPRIFDPFFSTWPHGGTGLGLAISADVVRQMGGSIEVESHPGTGSSFTVELPVRDVEKSKPTRTRTVEGGRVLIVEDERVLAAAMARQLAGRFDVELAHDGQSALRALELADFDVVLCDVRLPDTLGMQLFESATLARPAIASRFVFVTGDALDVALQEFVARHGLSLLEKPFDATDLERVVLRTISAS